MTANYRLAAVAAAVLVLIGGLVAVVRHSGNTPKLAPVRSQTSASQTPGQAAVGTASTARSNTSASDLAAFHLPALGTYRYHFERVGTDPVAYDATDIFAAAHGGFTETLDHVTAKESHTDVLDHGDVKETLYSFDSTTTKSPCKWSKAILMVPANPTPNQQWSSTASCATSVDKSAIRIEYEATSKVIGVKQAKVGNVTVPLLRIDRVVTLRTTVKGQTAIRQSSFVQYYDTARGLLAQSIENATDQSPSGAKNYRIVESMLTLQPEVSR
jgi:hypothetical protein